MAADKPLIGITLDCVDLARVASFWEQALGYERRDDFPGEPFLTLFAPSGTPGLHHLTLQRVPEPKEGKVRMHLDLFVRDADPEVERLVAVGATVVDDSEHEGGRTVVLGDPEGHEFCVVALRRP